MWRRSKCVLNTISSFGRQLMVTSLDKPTRCTSLSQVTRTLNINYYSPNIHHQTRLRFMSNDTCSGSSSSSSNDIEIVKNIYSMMVNYGCGCGGCFDTIAESSKEYRKTLLSHKFFLKMMDDPPRGITEDTWDAYFNWVLGRDDFKMVNRILTKIIHALTSPYVSQIGGADKYLNPLWSMMQRRRVEFKKDGVVTTQLLNCMLDSLSFSSVLRKVDHSLTSIRMLDMFPEFGCVPDFDSYKWTAVCCARLDPDEDPRVDRLCRDMCDFIRTHPNVCVSGMLGLFFRERQLKLAHAVYVAAKDRSGPSQLCLTDVFYLIRLLSYSDHNSKSSLCLALDMLADLSSESRSSKGSGAAFSAVVVALCTKHNDVHGARKLVEEMILKGPPPGIKAFNALVKSLCLTGDLEGAFCVLQLAESRGLKPDLGSYRLLIKGYKKSGMMDQASKVMSMATHKHPNSTIKVQLA